MIGCFVRLLGVAHQGGRPDPFGYVRHPPGVFLIVGVVVMVFVMSLDYEWLRERAKFFYGVTIMLLVLVVPARHGQQRRPAQLRPRPDQPAAGRVRQGHGAARARRVPRARTRSDEVSYPRFLGGLSWSACPTALIIIQPDLGIVVGARGDGDGRAARRRRQAEVHRPDHA